MPGTRSGGLMNLRPQDVHLDGNRISIRTRDDWQSKPRGSRNIPIHARLKPHPLAAMKASFGKPYIFCAPASAAYPKGDHQYSPDKLLLRVQTVAKNLGLETGHKKHGLVVHSLRHFFRTFCTNSRIPERAVDVWMGHVGKADTGALYYQLADDESQDLMKQVPFDRKSAKNTNSKGESNAA